MAARMVVRLYREGFNGMNCTNCEHYQCDCPFEVYGDTDECMGYVRRTYATRADYIRAMSDEELAEFLSQQGVVIDLQITSDGMQELIYRPNPNKCIIEWLLQPPL